MDVADGGLVNELFLKGIEVLIHGHDVVEVAFVGIAKTRETRALDPLGFTAGRIPAVAVPSDPTGRLQMRSKARDTLGVEGSIANRAHQGSQWRRSLNGSCGRHGRESAVPVVLHVAVVSAAG